MLYDFLLLKKIDLIDIGQKIRPDKRNCDLGHHIYVYIKFASFYAIKTIQHGDGLCYLFILRSERYAGVKRSIDFGFKRHPLLSPRQLTRYAHLRSPARVFPLLVHEYVPRNSREDIYSAIPYGAVSDDFGES